MDLYCEKTVAENVLRRLFASEKTLTAAQENRADAAPSYGQMPRELTYQFTLQKSRLRAR